MFLLSWVLFINIGYYLYALNVGADIDPSLIPSWNSYYKEVEYAIKSEDISRKIHIPTDLVVAQEASDVESSSRFDFLLLHNLRRHFVA